jgi:hypothetical protein
MASVDVYELLRNGPTAPGRGEDVLIYRPSEGAVTIASGGTRNGVTLASDLLRFNADGTVSFVGALASNLAFSGAARRITGDLSNATLASRLMAQSSTTNGNTTLGMLPNGTATGAGLESYNTSDPDNAGRVALSVAGATARLATSKTGTGTEPATLAIASALGDIISIDTATGAVTFNYPTTVGGIRVATENLLTNPGFEVWQRGAGPFTTQVYTADRWVAATAGAVTHSISRDGVNVDAGSLYAAAVDYTHVGGGALALNQAIEDDGQLRGRTITFAVRVRSSVAGTVKVRLTYDATNTDSAYNVGTGWERLSVTVAIPASAASVSVQVRFDFASCTAYLDNATLVVGSAAADYVPLHPADDLARCERYYELHGGGTNAVFFSFFSAAVATYYLTVPLRAEKPVTPTVTLNGTWTSLANTSAPSISSPTVRSFLLVATANAATGARYGVNTDSADDTVTVEANP